MNGPDTTNWSLGIVGAILALLGLMLLALLLQNILKVRKFKSTQALLTTVKKEEIYSESFPKKYKIVAEYTYEVNGNQYRGNTVNILDACKGQLSNYDDSLFNSLKSVLPDTPITIWFNINNPGDSIITKKVYWKHLSNIFILTLSGLLLAYYNLYID